MTTARNVSLLALALGVVSGGLLWRYGLPAPEYHGVVIIPNPGSEDDRRLRRTKRWSHIGLALLMASFVGQAVALYL